MSAMEPPSEAGQGAEALRMLCAPAKVVEALPQYVPPAPWSNPRKKSNEMRRTNAGLLKALFKFANRHDLIRPRRKNGEAPDFKRDQYDAMLQKVFGAELFSPPPPGTCLEPGASYWYMNPENEKLLWTAFRFALLGGKSQWDWRPMKLTDLFDKKTPYDPTKPQKKCAQFVVKPAMWSNPRMLEALRHPDFPANLGKLPPPLAFSKMARRNEVTGSYTLKEECIARHEGKAPVDRWDSCAEVKYLGYISNFTL
jgi:hypothetical protein